MQQGELVELEITDLNSRGDGVGRFNSFAVFVPDTVTGDRALVRLVRCQRQYAKGKLQQVIEPSPHRIRPRCIVADKCGGCQWQQIEERYQGQAKRQQVIQALERIGGFSVPPVSATVLTGEPLGYRNKATYPLGLSATGKVQAGYYRRQTHQLVNLNQCPVQDGRLNPLLAAVKQDIQQRGWTIYDESCQQGQLRYLSLRVGRRTGEILLTLVSTERELPGLAEQARTWQQRYPSLVGVALHHNPYRTNAIWGGETFTIAGKPSLREIFAGVEFHLRPDTFFQINTEVAESLWQAVVEHLDLQGDEWALDAYCGVGTFTLPLARQVGQAIGLEVQAAAAAQARLNALHNQIDNVTFLTGKVETLLPQLDLTPDLVLLDPPRQGCDRAVLEVLRDCQPSRLAYISCQPATLARDLQILCQGGCFRLSLVLVADFFPQTPHVECAAFLDR